MIIRVLTATFSQFPDSHFVLVTLTYSFSQHKEESSPRS